MSTDKRVEEGNRLIAEFMGWNGFPKYKELEWNLLMPAIQKAVRLIKKYDIPHGIGGGYISVAELFDLPIHTPVKTARRKLINFITWYQAQLK